MRVLAANSEVNQIVLGELLTMEEAEFTMVHDGSQAVDRHCRPRARGSLIWADGCADAGHGRV